MLFNLPRSLDLRQNLDPIRLPAVRRRLFVAGRHLRREGPRQLRDAAETPRPPALLRAGSEKRFTRFIQDLEVGVQGLGTGDAGPSEVPSGKAVSRACSAASAARRLAAFQVEHASPGSTLRGRAFWRRRWQRSHRRAACGRAWARAISRRVTATKAPWASLPRARSRWLKAPREPGGRFGLDLGSPPSR